jgi:hypothetical protein
MNTALITVILAVVGATTGVIGLCLSILNTWRLFDRDRIRLKVQVRDHFTSLPIEGVNNFLGVTVVNVGYIAVTVSQIEFSLKKPKKHVLSFIPFGPISDSLPKRLEPRTSMQVLTPPQVIFDKQFDYATRAIVRTQCGQVFRGSRSDLKRLIKLVRGRRGDDTGQ